MVQYLTWQTRCLRSPCWLHYMMNIQVSLLVRNIHARWCPISLLSLCLHRQYLWGLCIIRFKVKHVAHLESWNRVHKMVRPGERSSYLSLSSLKPHLCGSLPLSPSIVATKEVIPNIIIQPSEKSRHCSSGLELLTMLAFFSGGEGLSSCLFICFHALSLGVS